MESDKSKVVMSEAEYLRTSFDGTDHEFRDGEIVERCAADLFHGFTHAALGAWFVPYRKTHRLYACMSLRLRMREGRIIIPDVCVFWPHEPTQAIPENQPLIAIEILSGEELFIPVRTSCGSTRIGAWFMFGPSIHAASGSMNSKADCAQGKRSVSLRFLLN